MTLLYTASFYAPKDWVGRLYRVSRSHPRGKKAQWETLPFFYPQRNLLRAYRGDGMDFAGFELEYRQGLTRGYYEVSQLREWLQAVPSLGEFTLLCFERSGGPCHRLALARWLLERVPSLQVLPPQASQNAASGRFSRPQPGQSITDSSYFASAPEEHSITQSWGHRQGMTPAGAPKAQHPRVATLRPKGEASL